MGKTGRLAENQEVGKGTSGTKRQKVSNRYKKIK